MMSLPHIVRRCVETTFSPQVTFSEDTKVQGLNPQSTQSYLLTVWQFMHVRVVCFQVLLTVK